MRKRKLITLAFLVSIVSGLIIINSCSKNDILDNNQLESKRHNSQINDFSPSDENIFPLIEAFNSRYDNFKLGYKTGEDVMLNEAMWNLEAGVNYEFRSNKDSITYIVYDSTFVVISISTNDNGELLADGNDVMTAYGSLLSFTNSVLSENGQTNYLLMADVEITELTDETATLKMTAAQGPIIFRPWSCYVQNSDYWNPVLGMGYCDGDSIGLGQGQDASSRLNGLFNKKRCMAYGCSGTIYFTNVNTYSYIYYYENQNNLNCFWQGSSSECLSPQEMNYWLDNGFYAIEGMRPEGKVFIDILFSWDVIVGHPTFVHYINWVRYGKINCTDEGAGS